jgi:hypothetical protein
VAAAGPAAGPAAADAERGLLFVALNTDLSRQFEHVQQSWLNHAKFDGLHDEVCPISSGRGAPSDAGAFTVPGTPLRRRVRGWPKVVRVRGSAYALLLGRPGLRRLLDEPGWWG